MRGEQVTILHPGGAGAADEYGNVTPGAPTAEVRDGVAVAPGDTRENMAQQSTVEVAYTLYFTEPVTIKRTAQIKVRGEMHDVEGQPKDWRNPFTSDRPGTEVAVFRAG